MTRKINKMTNDIRTAKKSAVLGTEKKGRLPFFAIIIFIVLAAGGAFFVVNRNGKEVTTVSPDSIVSQIKYPLDLFDDGLAHHFDYKDDDTTIRYFILKSSDGVVRAAFDACDVCWPASKGYIQDGDFMVCRNCGRSFASNLINEVQGGCNPAPLNRKIKDGNLIIKVNDILNGKQYFDFSGKA